MCFFRDENNKTKVDIDVATLTNFNNYDKQTTQDALEAALGVAISDGDVGGYKVDTDQPPLVTVGEPKKSAHIMFSYLAIALQTSIFAHCVPILT